MARPSTTARQSSGTVIRTAHFQGTTAGVWEVSGLVCLSELLDLVAVGAAKLVAKLREMLRSPVTCDSPVSRIEHRWLPG